MPKHGLTLQDFDGSLANKKFRDEIKAVSAKDPEFTERASKELWSPEHTKALIKTNVPLNKEIAKQTISEGFVSQTIAIGSNRQSNTIDEGNAANEELVIGSCYPALGVEVDEIQRLLQEKGSDVKVTKDTSLLSDIYGKRDLGTNLAAALQNQAKGIRGYRSEVPLNEWAFDESKLSIIYFHAHNFAAQHQGEEDENVVTFYDDRADILLELKAFFEANPDYLPKNTTLRLCLWDGTNLEKKADIKGTGQLDRHPKSSVRKMARMANVYQEDKERKNEPKKVSKYKVVNDPTGKKKPKFVELFMRVNYKYDDNGNIKVKVSESAEQKKNKEVFEEWRAKKLRKENEKEATKKAAEAKEKLTEKAQEKVEVIAEIPKKSGQAVSALTQIQLTKAELNAPKPVVIAEKKVELPKALDSYLQKMNQEQAVSLLKENGKKVGEKGRFLIYSTSTPNEFGFAYQSNNQIGQIRVGTLKINKDGTCVTVITTEGSKQPPMQASYSNVEEFFKHQQSLYTVLKTGELNPVLTEKKVELPKGLLDDYINPISQKEAMELLKENEKKPQEKGRFLLYPTSVPGEFGFAYQSNNQIGQVREGTLKINQDGSCVFTVIDNGKSLAQINYRNVEGFLEKQQATYAILKKDELPTRSPKSENKPLLAGVVEQGRHPIFQATPPSKEKKEPEKLQIGATKGK